MNDVINSSVHILSCSKQELADLMLVNSEKIEDYNRNACRFKLGDVDFIFNIEYVKNVFTCLEKEETVTVYWNQSITPLLFKTLKFSILILPMRH
jgi:hypothetical protein